MLVGDTVGESSIGGASSSAATPFLSAVGLALLDWKYKASGFEADPTVAGMPGGSRPRAASFGSISYELAQHWLFEEVDLASWF